MSGIFLRRRSGKHRAGGGGGGGGGCGVVLATIYDDNFDCGSSVDTAGTRFSGALAWTAFNHGSGATFVQSGGELTADPGSFFANMAPRGYVYALPAGDFTFEGKLKPMTVPGAFGGAGLMLRESATEKALCPTIWGTGSEVRRQPGPTAQNWSANYSSSFVGGGAGVYEWLRVSRVGATLSFDASNNGSSWTSMCTPVSQTVDFTTAPDRFGFFANQMSTGGTPFTAVFDYIKRTA